MKLNDRYDAIIEWFRLNRPSVRSELNFSNGFELLCAVMLSAQCTDKRVNMVTPALFGKYPTPKALSEASFEDLYAIIRSVSYPNSKGEHLIGMSKMLVSDFYGEIPDSVEKLMKLPGVGRKTANVVASILFNEPVIAVDTHVFRVSHRIGLSKGSTPEKVEMDLTAHIPAEYRATAHHWLILHGRYICTARNPKCHECGISQWCKEYEKNKVEYDK